MTESSNRAHVASGLPKRPPVFVAMAVPDHVRYWIEAACEAEWFTGPGRPDRALLAETLPGVVGLLTSNQVRVDNALIEANPQLVVVSNYGVGYDNVDIPFATGRGLLVCNTPDVLTNAVADLTYGFMLALARRIVEAHGFVRDGGWRPGQTIAAGADLRGKTLGIIGFGRIGHEVARRAGAFGLRPLYYDPLRDPEAEADGLAAYAEHETVLRQADFLTVHVFLDETSRGLFDDRAFSLMKPTAFFINTSRGPVVQQQALVRALRDGRIAGAALDVFETEPIPADDPILSAPSLLLAPHIGSGTTETRRAMIERAARNLIAAVTGGVPESMVNPEVLRLRT